METYEGVRFETRFVRREAPVSARASELLAWCRRFVEEGLASGGEDASGNLSVRLDQGFLITPTHVPLSTLKTEQLVHVIEADLDANFLLVEGALEPSSESFLHAALYDAHPDVDAVFHGHSSALVRHGARAGIATTPREAPYGTAELAELAVEASRKAPVFVLAGHGFVALGRSADEAGRRALGARDRVREAAE